MNSENIWSDHNTQNKLQASKSLGYITRRPQKNHFFARKKQHEQLQQISHLSSINTIRDKPNSSINILQHSKSGQAIHKKIRQELKFVSPKPNLRNSKLNTQNAVKESHTEISPKFIRKNRTNGNNSNSQIASLEYISLNEQLIEINQFTPTLSIFSLQSMSGKGPVLQTSNTNDQWGQIKLKNDTLQLENKDLKKQIIQLKSFINKFKLEKTKNVPLVKCKNCQKLFQIQAKYKRQLSLCQFSTNQYKKQMQIYRAKRNQIQKEFKEISKAYVEISAQIIDKNGKILTFEKQINDLKMIINSQHIKLQNDSKVIESLSIQLHVLLRVKEENLILKEEKSKNIKDLINEKEIVKKLQTKVFCLQKILKRKQLLNLNYTKNINHPSIFDLSSDFEQQNSRFNIQ